jgi:hypothetical protein
MTTTRPGSEKTDFTVGDKVRVNREEPAKGSWGRYDGREGWVCAVNHQKFPDGNTYVELGVSFLPSAADTKRSADAWFRNDELVPT